MITGPSLSFWLLYVAVLASGAFVYWFTAAEFRTLGRQLGVSKSVSVPLFLLAALGFVWVWRSGLHALEGTSEIPVAVAGALWLLGVCLVAVALGNVRTFVRSRRTETTDTGRVSPGVVEVCGEARPIDGTVSAPLSGADALWAEHEITERRRLGFRNVSRTVDTGTTGTPFAVDDGTGPVTVDPDEAEIRLGRDRESTRVVDSDEKPSATTREYLQAETDLGPTDNRRTYTERRLEPGDEVYVLGVAEREYAGTYPTNAVVGAESSDCFLAPGTAGDVERSLYRSVLVGGPVGIVLAVAGFAAMAVLAGAV